MSLNFKNKIISESSPDIMEHLIKKLETRQRNLYNYANMINSINTIEDFYYKKKDIFNLFQNLKEEFKQAENKVKQNGAAAVFNCEFFTVKGAKLESQLADVKDFADFTPETEAIKTFSSDNSKYYDESAERSAPYFDVGIDGITLLNSGFPDAE